MQTLRAHADLRVMIVIPRFPDQDGRLSMPPNLVGRDRALGEMAAAGPGRVAVYGLENHAGTPVYVHAKTCIVDDVWASIGSDNFNRRSWTHDSELSCAVLDEEPTQPGDRPGTTAVDAADTYARTLRLTLAREHLDRSDGDDVDLVEPDSAFNAFRRSAGLLDAWHAGGRRGPRPAGRLRAYGHAPIRWPTRIWSTALYHGVYDPDGRPNRLRRQGRF